MMEVELREIEMDEVRLRLGPNAREVHFVELRRAVELRAARLVALRFAVKGDGVLAELRFDPLRGGRDVRGVRLRARPRAARGVIRDGALVRRFELRLVLDRVVSAGDGEHPVPASRLVGSSFRSSSYASIPRS